MADRAEPKNLDGKIIWLLSQVSDDLDVWKSLVQTYDVDIFCGLFMQSNNDGVSLSSEVLLMLGQRGIELGMDIYDAGDTASEVSNSRFDTDASRGST
jgi:hypothetical protein